MSILLRYDSLRLLLLPPVVLHDRLVEVMSNSLMFCGMIALVAMPLQGTDAANAWVQRDSQWFQCLRALFALTTMAVSCNLVAMSSVAYTCIVDVQGVLPEHVHASTFVGTRKFWTISTQERSVGSWSSTSRCSSSAALCGTTRPRTWPCGASLSSSA